MKNSAKVIMRAPSHDVWSQRMDRAEERGGEGCFACGYTANDRRNAVCIALYRDDTVRTGSAKNEADVSLHPLVHWKCLSPAARRIVTIEHNLLKKEIYGTSRPKRSTSKRKTVSPQSRKKKAALRSTAAFPYFVPIDTKAPTARRKTRR